MKSYPEMKAPAGYIYRREKRDFGEYYDREELITCEDCIYWWESHKMCKRNKDKNHNCACMDCDANFYCKNAERREE